MISSLNESNLVQIVDHGNKRDFGISANSLTREPYNQRSIDYLSFLLPFDFPKLSLPLPLVSQAALVTRLNHDYSYNDRKMKVRKNNVLRKTLFAPNSLRDSAYEYVIIIITYFQFLFVSPRKSFTFIFVLILLLFDLIMTLSERPNVVTFLNFQPRSFWIS